MKTIVLARHAKSDWSIGLPDIDRPLNKRGMEDAPRMGNLLKTYDFQPDLLFSSPANRAQTTARLVTEAMECKVPIQIDDNIYGYGYGQVLNMIKDFPDTADTAIVFGHNPTTEHLVAFLLQMRAGITVPTCGMVCIDLNISSWTQLNPLLAQLRWFIIPKLIKHFPS